MASFPPPAAPMSIRDALASVAQALTDAGVKAVVDPADLTLPGAVVYPNAIDYDTLGAGDYQLTVDVVLVAGGIPTLPALDQLDGLLGTVRALWAIGEARAVSITLTNLSPDPLPGLTTSITFNVSPDTEG